jgi:histidine triad (HIT) family protein
MENCIFCKIASKESPSHVIWENNDFMAFLSIFPEIEGMTIVIPKKHLDSYIFKADSEVMHGLMEASRETAKLLDTKLEGIIRTKLVFEGLEVPHLHSKLYPMYENRHPVSASEVSRADDKDLADLANKIVG